MSADPEIRIQGKRVQVRLGRKTLVETSLGTAVGAIRGSARSAPEHTGVLPRGVRIWEERRDAVAAAIEVPPHPRTVRWLADDSPEPFGSNARYRDYHVSFPYVVLLLVLRRGFLTGQQQLYYRTESLEKGQDLLLPNLYNVAQGYQQRCWVCLQHLTRSGSPSLAALVSRVIDHVFTAAFNRSADLHEGNSYWTSRKAVDPRVATMAAWEEATRENPLFGLRVPWEPAGATARGELRAMLDRVVGPGELESSVQLASLLSAAAAGT